MKRLLPVLLLLALASPVFAQSPTIEYTLTVKNPVAHLYDIQVDISGIRGTQVDVAMPAWSPGVYTIRDFAKNVQEFDATTRQNRTLSWQQTDKQTWRITKAAGDDVRLRYRVYSAALTDEMADITPAGVFMYVAGQTQSSVSVKYDVDGSWKTYTGLEKRGDRYTAASYDVLAASPAFIGDFKVVDVKSKAGIPYRVVFSNARVQMTPAQIEADIEDVSNEAAVLFGKMPFKDYTFLVKVQPTPGASAVGYLNSARVTIGENDFVNQNSYDNFLYVSAQSLAQSWLGNRVRPQSMLPYDFSKEAYSRSLWFIDGASAYSAEMMLMHTKIIDPVEYLQRAGGEIDALQHQPGRRLMSLSDASWRTWTRSDNGANGAITHTLKGKIAALLLDAEIRGKTGGAKSLNDAVRALIAEADQKLSPLADDALLPSLQRATGIDLQGFFKNVVTGREEIDYASYLTQVGLKVTSSRGPNALTLGIEFQRTEANQVRLSRIVPGTPAEAAKLDVGDIVVAMDSERVTYDNLVGRIHGKPIGKAISLSVLRGERLLTLSLMATASQTEAWSLLDAGTFTPQQTRLRENWLKAR